MLSIGKRGEGIFSCKLVGFVANMFQKFCFVILLHHVK